MLPVRAFSAACHTSVLPPHSSLALHLLCSHLGEERGSAFLNAHGKARESPEVGEGKDKGLGK